MDPHRLKLLLTLLDSATCEWGDDAPAMLVPVVVSESTPGGFELRWKDVDGHPVNSLLGLVPDNDWVAIGVVSNGTSYTMDEPTDPSHRVGCPTTVLLTRDGSMYGTTTFADARVIDDPHTEGIIADCMRRVFGLATAPPQQTTDELFAIMWLNEIVMGRAESWEVASRLHPSVKMLANTDLVTAAMAMASVCNWATVGELVTAKGWWNDLVPAEHVEWMGLGLMSRWLFNNFQQLSVLVNRVSRECPPAIDQQVKQTLIELGIPVKRAAGGTLAT